MAELPDFDQHRARGIAFAQGASGNLWTDYNVHDPGVTMLEQYCFALTELEYRADFDTADLLTNPDFDLDLKTLGLHQARQVLPTRPVTPGDLTLALAETCPLVRRVMIYPGTLSKTADMRGLYDIYVVPDRDAEVDEVLNQVRSAYHATRNLCEDIGTLGLARPLPCKLQAKVEVQRRFVPERVAAQIYDRCAQLMSEGDAAGKVSDKVSRRQAFDQPELLFGKQGQVRGGSEFIDLFFLALADLQAVEDVLSLEFEVIGGLGGDPFRRVLAEGEYRKLIFPQADHEIGLTLSSRGMEIRVDLAALQIELKRLRSERRERAHSHVDAAEWDRVPGSTRRGFGHARIGEALPGAYFTGHDLPNFGLDTEAKAAALQMRGFLGFSDAPIANASADLGDLPSLFAANAGTGATYGVRPLDFGAVVPQHGVNTDRLAEISAEFDPWRDRKGRALDYLLGLYAEEFSQNSLRLHDAYHGPQQRQDEILQNRAGLLQEIASLDQNRSAAADFTASQSSRSVGIGRKLTLLLSFADGSATALTAALERIGLSLTPAAGDFGAPLVPHRDLIAPNDPFHALVPRLDPVPGFAQSKLISQTEFMAYGSLNSHIFRTAARLDAYAIAQDLAGHWGLYLDVNSDDGVLPCGKFTSREAAVTRANQLCRMLADLNEASEGLYIVEDILLRGTAHTYDPLMIYVVIGGWSTRTVAADFRQLAEETVGHICPAHIRHRVLWLDYEQSLTFQQLHLAWRISYRDQARGAARVNGLDTAAQDLRRFLASDGAP